MHILHINAYNTVACFCNATIAFCICHHSPGGNLWHLCYNKGLCTNKQLSTFSRMKSYGHVECWPTRCLFKRSQSYSEISYSNDRKNLAKTYLQLSMKQISKKPMILNYWDLLIQFVIKLKNPGINWAQITKISGMTWCAQRGAGGLGTFSSVHSSDLML